MARNNIDLGVATNAAQIGLFVRADPLTAQVRLRSLGVWPFINNYTDPAVIPIAFVMSSMASFSSGHDSSVRRMAVTIGEMASPVLPAPMIATRNQAENFYMYCFENYIISQGYQAICVPPVGSTENFWTAERLAHFNGAAATDEPIWPPIIDAAHPITARRVMMNAFYMASFLTLGNSQLQATVFSTAWVSLAKRGTVSEEMIQKVVDGIKTDLGLTITINADCCKIVYAAYMKGMNGTNAGTVFTLLSNLIPDIAMRLKLTLTQTIQSGLASLSFIHNAMTSYHDFGWARVDRLTGGDVTRAMAAFELVGNNLYFGFNRDLGAAKSTRYSSLCWVAMQLLVRVGGQVTIRRYGAFNRQAVNRPVLEAMITEYIDMRVAAQNRAPDEDQLREDNNVAANWRDADGFIAFGNAIAPVPQ
uniref:Nucleoprotein n=1 Tax=Hymenopteran chu-related virus OKIAV146 TaxID=2792591 RepID=A0A7T0Q5F6_9VIRU|nr:nucleoprotein [Hymenopteran chu-related virus OKIAV146]